MARPKYEPAPPEKRPLARSSSARSVGRAAAQPRAAAVRLPWAKEGSHSPSLTRADEPS